MDAPPFRVSSDYELLARPTPSKIGHGREAAVGLALVPVPHRADVIGEWLELAVEPPPQRLDTDLETLIEANRVHDVPAVEPMLGNPTFLTLP